MKFVPILAAALLAACSASHGGAQQIASASAIEAADPPKIATEGAVSSADPRATEAGMEMLRRGGSATDAAIATMLALTVVEPQSSGIGGGGFLVRGTADGVVLSYDGRETAPSGAGPGWFYDASGELPAFRESVMSGRSVGVPGNIALAAEAHARHGKLPWAALFEPAIALARDGFTINPRLYGYLERLPDRAGFSKAGKALFYDAAGAPHPVGYTLRNPELAETLDQVAKRGPAAFYEGGIGQQAARVTANATPSKDEAARMRHEDFLSYEAKERAPVCGTYRGYRICGMGPPSSGGVAVLQILKQLERFDLAAMGADDPNMWHLFLESQRLAYADRELYLADSDFVSVPVAGLVDPAYLARRSAFIDPTRALTSVEPGRPAGVDQAWADGDEGPEKGTSHFAVVDGAGTMVSYTSTIEGPFGSGLMAAGFYLNNELTDFSRSPEKDGKPVANRVEGGKRPRSSMAPTVVWDPEGQPVLAVGAAGGSTIPVQTARAIIGVVDFGLPAQEALGLPLIMAFGNTVIVEKGTWLEEAVPQLEAMGHSTIRAVSPPLKGNAVQRTQGGWIGSYDPRLEGTLIAPD